jgi:hypothetical protein
MSKSVLLELPVVGVCRRAEIRESRTERSSGCNHMFSCHNHNHSTTPTGRTHQHPQSIPQPTLLTFTSWIFTHDSFSTTAHRCGLIRPSTLYCLTPSDNLLNSNRKRQAFWQKNCTLNSFWRSCATQLSPMIYDKPA